MATSTPSESTMGYSDEEIAEMRGIFDKFDRNKNGILNTHEFTNALQLMEYKYNEQFVIEVLKLVFDDEWEKKRNDLKFEDFVDFMSEFEPVHYEVLDKIEAKLQKQNITDIESDDSRIINLLKYVQMNNGTLLLNEIDNHINKLHSNHDTIESVKSPKSLPSLGLKSPFQKPPLLSPTSLAPITENNDGQNIQNAENNDTKDIKQNDEDVSPKQFEKELLNDTINANNKVVNILEMDNEHLIEWLNTDKTFNTTMIRKECCNIIQSQLWNGDDMLQALKLNKIDEILLLFKTIENYQYIIESIKKSKPADIKYDELLEHLEIIKSQPISQENTEPQQQQQEEEEEPMELKAFSPSNTAMMPSQNPPTLKNMRTISMRSKAVIDADDEAYTQNVWKQILRFFDVDNDGTISVDEMAPALRSLGIDISDTKLHDMISKMDQDESGTIDYTEFKHYYHALFQEKIKKGLDWKYIHETFEKYDGNCSGFLDIDEFTYALKKLCVHITNEDIKAILHSMDTSNDHCIEFDEFIDFLESEHPKAQWVLKKLIRSSIPTPMEYLLAFKGLPQHFRKSELAELEKHNSHRISEWIKPKIDSDGITLQNIQIDPKTMEIHRKFKTLQNIENLDESDDRKQNEENVCLQNVRVFKITECSGVPLPEPSMAARIIDRRMRLCLYSDNKPISNVFTIPASWKSTEEDQWMFGSNLWKESMSNTVSEWNTFCVAIEQNVSHKIELFIELCITLKPSISPRSAQLRQQPLNSPQLQQNNNITNLPQSPFQSNRSGLQSISHKQQQSTFNFRENRQISATNTEMSCGWSKLEIHSADMTLTTHGINFHHKLKIRGGSFDSESDINISDIHNDRTSGLSFRKLKQAINGVESVIKIHEESYNHFRNVTKECLKWVPENMICTVSSCKIIKLYYELMADRWLRNQEIFQFQFCKQNIYQTLLLFIVDRPNLLCVLIDEWKLKFDALWRSQRKDRNLVANEFKSLLKQFIPFLLHQKLKTEPLTSLNQERLSFVRQIVKGNVKQILNGNKPSSSIPLIYTPFSTDLFV